MDHNVSHRAAVLVRSKKRHEDEFWLLREVLHPVVQNGTLVQAAAAAAAAAVGAAAVWPSGDFLTKLATFLLRT